MTDDLQINKFYELFINYQINFWQKIVLII